MKTAVLLGLGLAFLFTVPRLAAQGPDGKALYEKNCRSCHGPRGIPPATLAKQMNIPKMDAAFFSSRSDEALIQVVKKGGKSMKGFEGKMTAEEMVAVAAYLRQTFGVPKPAQIGSVLHSGQRDLSEWGAIPML